ncbi:MAG: amidase family protein, partial [Candidatus Aenigmatarchaeota archaeon]
MDYSRLSVGEFIKESRAGSLDLEDFYSKLFSRIKELDKEYGFFVTIGEQPKLKDKKPGKGRLLYLPVSIKDNICVKGMRCTAGSRILENYVPPFDSTVSERIKGEG